MKTKESKRLQLKKRPRRGLESVIVVLAFIFILVISICSIGAITYMFRSRCAYIERGVESTLLSQGLAIIGMAIAVWTGLNILNVITRKDLERIDKRILRQEKKAAELAEKSRKQLKSIQESQAKPLFMQELLKSNKLLSNLYFYKLFDSAKGIAPSVWNDLIAIEQCFGNVYSLYGVMDVSGAELRVAANKGLELIQKFCEKTELQEVCKQYISFRKADFNFYKGYVEERVDCIYMSFHDAQIAYKEFLNVIGINKHFGRHFVPKELWENRSFAVFMANTIGESYSKISQNYNTLLQYEWIDKAKLDDYVEKSINYLECAVKWSSGTSYEGNEVIYRNLGCAYERKDNTEQRFGESANKIFKMYQKAFELAINDKTISLNRLRMGYHVLLSYYKKYIDAKLNINEKFVMSEGYTCMCSDELYQRIKEFMEYSEFILQEGRKYGLSVAMNGFAYFAVAFSMKYAGREYTGIDWQFCYDKIKKSIEQLELLGIDDDYRKSLENRLNILRAWF